MELLAAKARPALILGTLLVTACCVCADHHRNGYYLLDDVSWLLEWFSFARRASLVFIMLSGIVLYYVPETRAPTKDGCFFLIDSIANGLKVIIGKIDDSKDLNESYFQQFEGKKKEDDILQKQSQRSVSFNFSETDIIREGRHKRRIFQSENFNNNKSLKHRCKIHQSRKIKIKDKSSDERISIYRPLPLMQFNSIDRQNLNTSFGLYNKNCDVCLMSIKENRKMKNHLKNEKKNKPGKKSLTTSEMDISRLKENEQSEEVEYLDENNKLIQCNNLSHKEMMKNLNDGAYEFDRPIRIIHPNSLKSRKLTPEIQRKARNTQKINASISQNDRDKIIKLRRQKVYRKSYSQPIKRIIPKNYFNQRRGASFCDERTLLRGCCKSPLSRAFDWVFGGCLSAKSSRSFFNKNLMSIIQEQLPECFE